MKKKGTRKIDWFKLITFIIGTVTFIYLSICTISYTAKTTKQVKEYTPQERTTTIIK